MVRKRREVEDRIKCGVFMVKMNSRQKGKGK